MTLLSPDLFSDFGLRAVTASEIEFYLFGSLGRDLSGFWEEVKAHCLSAAIPVYNIEKERGSEQYEVSLRQSSPDKTASDTSQLKKIICDLAEKYDMQPDFSAKPLPDDFGSGLHIHVHLENSEGNNQFIKNDEVISDTLKHSLGGLLLWLPDTMPIFAPNAESYNRFVEGSNAPLTVSWGANNRTVALRLPDSEKNNKRIEHRVAGADADAEKVIAIILAAIHHGLTVKAEPSAQIYGDARLASYNLPKFPATLTEAISRMQQSVLPLEKG